MPAAFRSATTIGLLAACATLLGAQQPADLCARIAAVDHVQPDGIMYARGTAQFEEMARDWTEEQVRALVADENPKVRAVALIVLHEQLGHRAMPTLLQFLDDQGPAARTRRRGPHTLTPAAAVPGYGDPVAHVFEPAPSSRARCRGCGLPIGKGEVRFGERITNPFADGETTLWFHPLCAAYKQPEPMLEALAQSTDVPGREAPEHGEIQMSPDASPGVLLFTSHQLGPAPVVTAR